jgi:hypothetical protein
MRLSAQATQLADTSQAAQAEWSGKTGNFRPQAELPENNVFLFGAWNGRRLFAYEGG